LSALTRIQGRLRRTDNQTLCPARHRDVQIASVECGGVENDCHITFQSLQQQRTPHCSGWQRPADESILLTHPDCRILEAETFGPIAQLKRSYAGTQHSWPMRPDTALFAHFYKNIDCGEITGSINEP
jgi:hypothetical protein